MATTLPTAVNVLDELTQKFGANSVVAQPSRDRVPTGWVRKEQAHEILKFLKSEVPRPYRTLYDLTALDERVRLNRQEQPKSDFTVVYDLLSYDRNENVRLKVGLEGESPAIPTITDLWPSANWYEREVWDMFGIEISGHPNLRRILMPPTWRGHPLRKDHPARATEMAPFRLNPEKEEKEQEALQFNPEAWGMKRQSEDSDFMFLNVGPQHPGTHGIFRVILQLDGEIILDVVPDIGWHHRGAEKMGERQSWHTYIPYTDRVEYLSGVLNNVPYVLAVEQLAGIDVPQRAQVIRVMSCIVYSFNGGVASG